MMVQGGQKILGKIPDWEAGRPVFSIITVTFNAEKHLAQALDSILTQNYPNVELIVVDGGSTDQTLSIIRERETKISYWISEPDKGIYDAMNKGIALATGDFIGFKNADDWYEAGAFLKLEEAIQRVDSEVYYGNSLSVIQENPLKVAPFYTSHQSLGSTPGIDHRCSFVKTGWHKRIPFDLKYKLAADLDVFFRLKKEGARFHHISNFLAYKRFGGASDGTQILKETLEINTRYQGFAKAIWINFLVHLRYWKWKGSNGVLLFFLGKEGYNRFKARKLGNS
jgi:glycosyltransferase involved in cell wall biosynthesis